MILSEPSASRQQPVSEADGRMSLLLQGKATYVLHWLDLYYILCFCLSEFKFAGHG